MRHCLIWFIILFTGALASGQKYDYTFESENLLEIVKGISNQKDLKFSYNPKQLARHTVSKHIKANSNSELISELFEGLPFRIQLSDGVYLLIPDKSKQRKQALSGSIMDKQTGEPLAYAHVKSDYSGVVTNQQGRFSLPPRTDTVTLEISYLGYKKTELKIAPDEMEINVNLEQNPTVLKEIVLNTGLTPDLVGKPGFFSMNPQQFSALPSLVDTDVFKSIQLLPGVSATDESTAGLAIRGSDPANNLVLMDGFTLYHLDHFFGIFSTLNPNMINNVSIYKGGFASEYGGRVSAVIDVQGRTGGSEPFTGEVGINFLSMNGSFSSKIGKRTSFILGGRKSFTNIIDSDFYQDFLASNRQSYLQSFDNDIAELDLFPSVNFYDVNGKLQHFFNDYNRLDVNLFVSRDAYLGEFAEIEEDYRFTVSDAADWDNFGISLNYRSQVNNRWFSNVMVGYSTFENYESLSIGQSFEEEVSIGIDSVIEANEVIELLSYNTESYITDFTIKSVNEIILDNANSIKTGLELNTITTNFKTTVEDLFDDGTEVLFNDTLYQEAPIVSLFGDYHYNNQDFRTTVGLRTTFYEPTNSLYFEPRLSIHFNASDRLLLKGAASYHQQYVNQTTISAVENSDRTYLVLADDVVIPVLKSTHGILGANYTIDDRWTVDLELYRKNTDGIVDPFVNLLPQTLSFLEEEEINLEGNNLSEGLDLFVKYRSDQFTSWVSYSLARSEDKFWYRNDNNPYPSDNDQLHELNFVSIYKLGNWEFAQTTIYGSGRPYTPPTWDIEETDSPYDLERINDYRLPFYYRTDLSAKYTFAFSRFSGEVGCTLFNILGRNNVKSRRYFERYILEESEVFEDELVERRELVELDTYLLGFTPNVFLKVRF